MMPADLLLVSLFLLTFCLQPYLSLSLHLFLFSLQLIPLSLSFLQLRQLPSMFSLGFFFQVQLLTDLLHLVSQPSLLRYSCTQLQKHKHTHLSEWSHTVKYRNIGNEDKQSWQNLRNCKCVHQTLCSARKHLTKVFSFIFFTHNHLMNCLTSIVYTIQSNHSPDHLKFSDILQHSSATLCMLSVTHIMPILVLNTCMDANMQLTINSFRQIFPNKIFP